MNVFIVQIALTMFLFVDFVKGGLLGAGIIINHVYFTLEQFSLNRFKNSNVYFVTHNLVFC